MPKLKLACFSAAIAITGCASAPPPPQPAVSTYTYEQQLESGPVTVHVTDKHYSADALSCGPEWRDGELYTPNGVASMGRDRLKVFIDLVADGKDEGAHSFDVPLNLGTKVLTKDFQQEKSYMLGTEHNGLVQQGDFFSYPEGYVLRVSEPSVKGWDFIACIGIDHMYVLDSDLNSTTTPPVYLDRVVVPFAMEQAGQPVRISFGSQRQHTAAIRIKPE